MNEYLLMRRVAVSRQLETLTELPRVTTVNYKSTRRMKVLIASWNVNAKECTQLENWLSGDKPDIAVIGMQELIQLTSQSLAQDEAYKQITKTKIVKDSHTKYWKSRIEFCLSRNSSASNFQSKQKYTLVKDIRLSGIYLCVYVKSELYPFVQNVAVGNTKVGMLGKIVFFFLFKIFFIFLFLFLFFIFIFYFYFYFFVFQFSIFLIFIG